MASVFDSLMILYWEIRNQTLIEVKRLKLKKTVWKNEQKKTCIIPQYTETHK